MLPIEAWLNAMTIESGLPRRPPYLRHPAAGRGLRRAVGRRLIALGQALAGSEAVVTRTVSVGH